LADWFTPALATLFGAAAGAVSTALATIIVQRRPASVTADAQARAADAQYEKAIHEGFAKLLGEAMEQLNGAKAEIQMLRGELTNLIQHIDSLERLLREQGVDIPMRQRPHVLTVIPASKQ